MDTKATRVMLLAAALLGSGCSWFSHKSAKADAVQPDAAVAEAAAPAEAVPAPAPAPAPAAQSPEAAVVDFLTMHQRLGNSGLPDAGSMSAYNAFLCPSLAVVLRGARER
ncbi:MAG: hypothetical protein H7147_02360, partial [Frankiaceae bacterium]|nr:hypothetical protein [Arenimonas sp.]